MSEQPDPADDGNGLHSVFDAPRVGDSIFEGFDESRPARYAVLPDDGMPMPMHDDASLALAERLPLHPSTLICMADTSAFVLRQDTWGAEIARFTPAEVTRMPNGAYVVPTKLAAERRGERAGLGALLIALFVRILILMRIRRPESQWCEVEPVRPQCRFYRRQRFDHPADPERKKIERLCTARTDAAGVFLSLSDDRMHGCELREPAHQPSVDPIDRFDEEKIAEGIRLAQQDEEWDVDAALAAEEAEPPLG